jgi:hypothetical protein
LLNFLKHSFSFVINKTIFFSAFLLVLLHVFDSVVSRNTISNQDASSLIGAHIDPLFCPVGVFGDSLNRAAGHVHLTELQKLAFSDYRNIIDLGGGGGGDGDKM